MLRPEVACEAHFSELCARQLHVDVDKCLCGVQIMEIQNPKLGHVVNQD